MSEGRRRALSPERRDTNGSEGDDGESARTDQWGGGLGGQRVWVEMVVVVVGGVHYSQLLQFKKSKAAKIKTLFQTKQLWPLQ